MAINREWTVEVIGPAGTWTRVVWAESPKLAAEEVLQVERAPETGVQIGRVTLAPPRPPDPAPELKWLRAKRWMDAGR